VFYSEANAFDNIENLGIGYIIDMRKMMLDLTFRIEVLNEKVASIMNGFYANLDEHHLYDEYDYSFIIENETLESSFTMNKYQKMNIDFTNLFASNKINNNVNIYGLYCVIIKNGKTIRFKIEKSSARIINIFLGEKNTSLNNFSPSYSIDFYAFDKNLKLTNV
jgi:hypothetical protein